MTKDEAIEKLRTALKQVDDMSTGRLSAIARDALMATVTIEAPTSEAVAERDNRHDIGAMMANVMFNLAQKSGRAITEREAEAMDKLRKQWDEASFAAPVLAAVGVEKPQQGNAIRPLAEPAGQHSILFPAWSCDSIGWHSGYCVHEFDYMHDMSVRDNDGNVSCACRKCGETFKAKCGLDLPGRLVQINTPTAQPAAAPAPTDAGIPISNEREAFEAADSLSHLRFEWSDIRGEYRDFSTQHAWEGWQARGQQQAGVAEAPDGWIAEAIVGSQQTSVAFRNYKTAKALCVKGEPFAFHKARPSVPGEA